ncbi:hypothetical protein TrVE_jg12402 [Triparma verrucosa]|uniref:SET domain-containing protein n=1 Tax=Triparma verrucosa TaxID=1606542 RepID=A0A9W7CIC7_9STRA|nr:hypothetical protein TrVE_jg12402 [Triparma verrucosa]
MLPHRTVCIATFLILLITVLLPPSTSFPAAAGFGAKKVDPMSNHILDTSEGISYLKDFLNKNGGNSGTKCDIAKINGKTRGVICTRSIKKDEIICSLPSSLALSLWDPSTPSSSPSTPSLCALNFKEWYLDDSTRLNTFAPYIGSLPTVEDVEFEPTPNFYSDSDVDKLEFPGIVSAVNTRKSEIDSAILKSDDVSIEDMKYYTWLVTSRSFSIRLSADDVSSGNAKSVRIMLPFFDMINHSGKSNAEMDILNPEKDDSTFIIRAKRPIAAGKEVTISYGGGGFSSVDLFTDYGFVQSKPPEELLYDEKDVTQGALKRQPLTPDERTMAKFESTEGYNNPWSTSLEEDVEKIKAGAKGRERKILEFRAKMKVAGGWPAGTMEGKMDLKKKEGGGK